MGVDVPQAAARAPASNTDDSKVQFLVGFSPPDGAYVTLPQKPMCSSPTFRGPLEDLEQYGFDIWNEAKVCDECGKSCAGMLSLCNGCNAKLSTNLTKTPNALLAFTYGVQYIGNRENPRCAKFSLRYQDEKSFAFDDMMSRTPMHLCCVPSDVIRDVKDLLSRENALEIISTLEEAGWRGIEASLTPEWLAMVNLPLSRIRELLMCGFNGAPSQFQLHLHVKVPPLLPEDMFLTQQGSRFTYRRWLPLEYVKACAAIRPIPVLGPNDDICDVFDKLGDFNYDTMMKAAVERYVSASEEANLWREDWFTHRVIDGKVIDAHGKEADGSLGDWVMRDKLAMQNFGRPFVNGKPEPINFYGYAPKVH